MKGSSFHPLRVAGIQHGQMPTSIQERELHQCFGWGSHSGTLNITIATAVFSLEVCSCGARLADKVQKEQESMIQHGQWTRPAQGFWFASLWKKVWCSACKEAFSVELFWTTAERNMVPQSSPCLGSWSTKDTRLNTVIVKHEAPLSMTKHHRIKGFRGGPLPNRKRNDLTLDRTTRLNALRLTG